MRLQLYAKLVSEVLKSPGCMEPIRGEIIGAGYHVVHGNSVPTHGTSMMPVYVSVCVALEVEAELCAVPVFSLLSTHR